MNGRLKESGHGAFADVHDDADYLSRSLDGAEEAFVGLALAVGQFFSTSPADNLLALQRMPAAVAALIASSPEYLRRFQYMTRGEQVQAVSRLATELLTAWGTASSVSRTFQGAMVGVEGSVPVLSLSAEGTLVLERVAVPVKQVAGVLSGGPGAAIILQRANAAAQGAGPPDGPGHWGPAKESMSPRARRYQEQISGRPADEAYWVRNVKFDGFENGVLLEAKGPGYANKFLENLKPKIWFEGSGAKALVEQAQRQLAVTPKGVPIRWCIAEEKTAEAIRLLFQKERVIGIEVIYVPPL
ncbi:putative hemagglutinin-related protein [Myxococcus hansupus]|uniref:Putative hemagglutinin-related protein n=1 Tax=Pseudomyxococcus hansupus TaxID=1297742 RepID=A0A0H4WYE2_9BACT|nr:putative hemagglutinin-related protein [Myxococcus hansupus]